MVRLNLIAMGSKIHIRKKFATVISLENDKIPLVSWNSEQVYYSIADYLSEVNLSKKGEIHMKISLSATVALVTLCMISSKELK